MCVLLNIYLVTLSSYTMTRLTVHPIQILVQVGKVQIAHLCKFIDKSKHVCGVLLSEGLSELDHLTLFTKMRLCQRKVCKFTVAASSSCADFVYFDYLSHLLQVHRVLIFHSSCARPNSHSRNGHRCATSSGVFFL